MRICLFLLCALPLTQVVTDPVELDWSVLADVKFRKKLLKEYNSVYLIPKFGKQPKALAGKEVILKGYLIPLSADFTQLVLSKSPYASCFFCGQSGPETVVELKLDPDVKIRRYRMDDYVEVRGTLDLNLDDVRSLPYRVTHAQIEKRR